MQCIFTLPFGIIWYIYPTIWYIYHFTLPLSICSKPIYTIFLGRKKNSSTSKTGDPRCWDLNMPMTRRPDKKAHGLDVCWRRRRSANVTPDIQPIDRCSKKIMGRDLEKCISLVQNYGINFGYLFEISMNICRGATINFVNLAGKIGNPS